jgi:DNA polymerase-3 subunit beta
MKFTADRSALVDRLSTLARGVSTRSALPVLSGILVQCRDGRLEMQATDMELSVKGGLPATIEREGEFVVPARLFADVVRNLPGDEVAVEGGEATVKVSAGRASFTLHAWLASDFPQTSDFSLEGAFPLAREAFVATLAKVGRAASRDETRPILTGVLVAVKHDSLKMVATDSYRLAVKETRLETPLDGEVQAIVPARALAEVRRLAEAGGAEPLRVAVGENQVVFEVPDSSGGVLVASRLIEGQFPSYAQLLPQTYDHVVRVGRDDLLAAARRVSLLAQKSAPLRLTFSEGTLTMRAITQDVGQGEETLDVEFSGEPFEIGFNPAFLIDGVEALDDETVTMRFTTPLRPGVISGDGEDFIYLIMPIRLSS